MAQKRAELTKNARRAAFTALLSALFGATGLAGAAIAAVNDQAAPPATAAAEPARLMLDVADADFSVVLARRMISEQKTVAGENVDLDRLRRFYAARGFAPAWLKADPAAKPPFTAAAGEAARAFQDAANEGLSPQAYHADAVARLAETDETAVEADRERRLALELLLTDGLLRYVRDVRAGRLPPQKISRDLDIDPPVVDSLAAAAAMATAEDPAAALKGLAPVSGEYRRLRQALAQLRQAERNGGWPLVPPWKGKTKLEPGASDPAVPALRQRLAASGDYAGPRSASTVYDAPLRAAALRFQARHGLEADGALGAAALAEINVSLDARIAQVTANMERARWLPDNLGDRYVKVNIPEFRLTAVDGGALVRSMRVVVGTKQRKTPMLSSVITSVILNPTWTMPPRLAKEDYLPKLQKNPGYLAEHGFTVYAGWNGGAKPLDARKINWKSLGPGAMAGLKLRQDPGPQNALGRIKFNIDNDFDVYLHDTPSRDKFERSMRALSSGCVRLGEPMALADFVFADMPEWGADQRKPVLDSLKTRYITLKRPTAVHILYQTAWVNDDGVLQFRQDIYDRDSELLNAVARAAPFAPAPARTAMNGG